MVLLCPPADVQKQLNEYRFKLKKSEQEITTLEGNVSKRYN